jgi:putative phage-type endonuclease
MKKHLQLIPTDGMTRQDWLTYRHTGLGASEVGAVLGLDDYMSSLELFYYKIGDAPRFDIEGMAQFMGREQEDLIARLWKYWDGDEDSMIMNFRDGHQVRRCQRVNAFLRNPRYPWLFVSLDRKINKHGSRGEGSLELKTIRGFEADKWEAGLPPKYVTQVQTQITVAEFDYGEMAILTDGRRFNVLPFDLSPTISEMILERTKAFWDRVQKARALVAEKYLAAIQFNQSRVDELNHLIDELAPEPDGTLVYAKFLSEKHNKPGRLERRGTQQELLWAQAQLEKVEQEKIVVEEKLQLENQLKVAMKDVQILDFGMDGKVHWAETPNGGRYFRNRVRRA